MGNDVSCVDVLRNTPFAMFLSPEVVQDISACFTPVKFKPGATIAFTKQEFLIVARGSVDVSTILPHAQKKVKVMELLCKKRVGDIVTHCATRTSRSKLHRKSYIEQHERRYSGGKKFALMLDLVTVLVCKENDLGDKFYICITGVLAVTVENDVDAVPKVSHRSMSIVAGSQFRRSVDSHRPSVSMSQVLIRRIADGSYFGEISLILNMKRSATVTAVDDSLLVYIDARAFRNFLKVCPDVRMQIEQVFYIVLNGKVEVDYDLPSGHLFVALGSGGYLNELSMILQTGSLIQATVREDSVLLALHSIQFHMFFSTLPEFFAEFSLRYLQHDASLEHVINHYDAHELWLVYLEGRPDSYEERIRYRGLAQLFKYSHDTQAHHERRAIL
ncbi:hypothetical protein DYB32_003412 [Aphanomyces invadans]|uniref:Cyclic nucleotide-binding domain-containing protein n=1 Tax=Aphanomyces invadans TaxID=157072 RepID=A0A3R6VD92_9STRA|nr:hypothetical protein DYB32_003412 [Aphanomyces invadans]